MMNYVKPRWAKCFPEDKAASLAVTIGASALAGIVDTLIATHGFGDYGFILFLMVPCAMGVSAPLLHGMGAPRTFGQCLLAAILAQAALFSGMLLFGIEGAGCIIMAAPLWLACACIGCCIAYPIHSALWKGYVHVRGFPVVGLILLAMIPSFMGMEHIAALKSPLMSVTTSVEIDAPPEVVWRHVISFPQLPKPQDWVFQIGAAYPIRAEILGHGVGAERHCVFSTGAFIEPITVWDENRLLAFNVTQSPPSMQEWSFYSNIHPPHLDGYFVSKHGQFQLTALPGGRTRLEGTTWYQNEMFPVAYWELWSDAIVHRIHLNVLGHIKKLSEADAPNQQR